MIHAIECDCPARIVRTFTDDVHVADPVIAAMSMSPLFWSSRGANMRPIDTAIRRKHALARTQPGVQVPPRLDTAFAKHVICRGGELLKNRKPSATPRTAKRALLLVGRLVKQC